MKILSIRGCNLTSLAGDFSLDLDKPPLDKMGLFAITGATGAGKSTLLDAMCLALFDRTPRLGDRGGVPVGRPEEDEDARLTAYDVRGVLRRGAGEGFAEVDFLGKDGRRYRARWSVWRARSRAEGRFRPQEMSLTDLATQQQFGRTKSEVLKAIEERLGLSFDQFRRSALLAQGEFAAFLRADANERAELLERMTGTEVYSRVSMAAHQRHKEVQEELEKLAQGVAAIPRLSEEERQAAEEGRAREEVALAEAQAAQAKAEQALRWYTERAQLVAQEADAEQSRQRAAEALEASEPRKAELDRVRAAEVLRAPLNRAAEESRKLVAAESALAARRAEAEAARALAQAREEARAKTEGRARAAVEAEAAARPALEEAVKLDAALERTRSDVREAAGKLDEARESERQARDEVARVAGDESAARSAMTAAQAWLTEHGRVAALAREWPRWEAELTRYERAAGEEARARGAFAKVHARAESLSADVQRRDEERRKANESVEAAAAAVASAEASLGEDAGSERRVRRESLLSRQETLRALTDACKGVKEAALAEQEASGETTKARAEQTAAATGSEAAKVRRIGHEAALKEARRALTEARATLDLAEYRVELRPGQPCPLCGATEHPYRQPGTALEGLATKAQGRVEELEGELKAAIQDEASANARVVAEGSRAAQAEARREAAAKRRIQQREAWSHSRAKLEGVLPPEDVEASDVEVWLESALTEAKARLAALKDEEETAEKLARAAKEARGTLTLARERQSAAEKAWHEAADALRQNTEAQASAGREVEQAERVRQEVLAGLAAPFQGSQRWEESLAADPAVFRARCAKWVAEWSTREQALREAETRVVQAEKNRAPAEALVKERSSVVENHVRELARLESVLRETQAARAGVLGGRSTSEVRAGLHRELEESSKAFELVRAEAERANQEAAAVIARAGEAVLVCESVSTARVEAEAALSALLSARSLTRESAQALLARDAAWCEAEERALAQLRQAHEHALSVLKERQAQRTRHEASGLPSVAEAEAAAACDQARADTKVRLESAARCKAILEQDDEARRRQGAQARLLEEKQRASGVWRTLSELIGSHDGRKFKVFAQSLTLDALLHYANAHLEELAPRYRLMRVPKYDLDLQVVDRDMGDEVRAVSSLSGGESFLVSLALALGLASLSSETTQVETLFIDEGFGTLDPATLEVALATLDALQATGRQVGIISHVSGLAERIGVQVRVVKQGAGRSRLVVVGEPGLLVPSAADIRSSVSVG
ncbi:AAA family ATPase [Vitiosangium sp. GDMCC 1.1324]|uniref:AAA family ATPase n=1 Tax=Vitiosangium sp. (strain GDMCC 1.1324) TaxID=2138576 RepID=UPI000D39238E|nr:AAA family ATPase [Vitiosangium sp. GDMCC 1.1324]PTL81776.1 nuclease SbcCD subunit C [Vitiosangium sp. GDMCC 1.1324]